MTQKMVRITCQSVINKSKKPFQGYQWRIWKVCIRPTDIHDRLSRYIKHVEYKLHESFEEPQIVCIQEPFVLGKEGWGEFDLGVVIHYKDQLSLPPQHIQFDLNFKKPKYSVYKSLNIETTENEDNHYYSSSSSSSSASSTSSRDNSSSDNKKRRKNISNKHSNRYSPYFHSSSNRSRAASSSSSASSVSTAAIATPAYDMLVVDPIFSFDNLQQQQDQSFYRSFNQKNKLFSTLGSNNNDKQHPLDTNTNSTITGNERYDSNGNGNGNGAENALVPRKVNIQHLANYLESLTDDNLRKVYYIILEYDRKDMYIVETETEVLFDLYSLGPMLLSRLWDFTTNIVYSTQK